MARVTVVPPPSVEAPSLGPAPNAGDGVSDSSGLDTPFGEPLGIGLAPNSGDSISDGSGL